MKYTKFIFLCPSLTLRLKLRYFSFFISFYSVVAVAKKKKPYRRLSRLQTFPFFKPLTHTIFWSISMKSLLLCIIFRIGLCGKVSRLPFILAMKDVSRYKKHFYMHTIHRQAKKMNFFTFFFLPFSISLLVGKFLFNIHKTQKDIAMNDEEK